MRGLCIRTSGGQGQGLGGELHAVWHRMSNCSPDKMIPPAGQPARKGIFAIVECNAVSDESEKRLIRSQPGNKELWSSDMRREWNKDDQFAVCSSFGAVTAI